jgi:hypothetical protein
VGRAGSTQTTGYTDHAVERMTLRGITRGQVQDVIEGSSKPAWQQDEGTFLFRNSGLEVAVNPSGTVVSVMGQLK